MRTQDPLRDPRFLKIVRGFGWDVRDYLSTIPTEPERELVANRFLGTVAVTTGAVLTVRNRRNDSLAAALFAVGLRLWTREPGS